MIGEYENFLGIYYNPNFVARLMFILPKEIASHEKVSIEKIEEILPILTTKRSTNTQKFLTTIQDSIIEIDTKTLLDNQDRNQYLNTRLPHINRNPLLEIMQVLLNPIQKEMIHLPTMLHMTELFQPINSSIYTQKERLETNYQKIEIVVSVHGNMPILNIF